MEDEWGVPRALRPLVNIVAGAPFNLRKVEVVPIFR
jgi:hypothetical protein